MGLVYLLLATLAWSFVGVLVKTASGMVDSTVITFLRFSIGALFLGLFLYVRNGRLQVRVGMKWVWIGAFGKSCNYFFENMALSIGYSYGNIIVPPIQTIVLLFVSVLLLKDRMTGRGWVAAALCMTGVLLISWNGQPVDKLLSGDGMITVLFVLAGVGAAIHVISQKMLIKDLDTGNMNFSTFFIASLIMALPIPVFGEGFVGPSNGWAWFSLLALGLITGLSFYWFAESLRRVSFPVVIIVSNTTVLFGILWSYLIFRDPITQYLIAGALIFIIGMVILNMPVRKTAQNEQASGS